MFRDFAESYKYSQRLSDSSHTFLHSFSGPHHWRWCRNAAVDVVFPSVGAPLAPVAFMIETAQKNPAHQRMC